MRINKTIILSALLGSALLSSCDNGFEEMNINPNAPESAPTYTIFPIATKIFVDEMRDGWVSGRMLLPWVQYSAQRNYTEEDKYAYRDAGQVQSGWTELYRAAANYQQIIKYASDSDYLLRYGYADGDNTIAVSRIMLAYTFDNLVTHFGDVPYWSYGSQDAEFQALQIDKFKTPVYASQEKIYTDILKELKEAEAQLSAAKADVQGDLIYEGDVAKWKKFANSLRLRIANRVKAKLPAAAAHITDAIAKGVITPVVHLY